MPPFLADIAPAWVAVALGAIGLAYGFVVKVWPSISTAKDLRDDIMGEPARPGVPARPGWGESIASMAATLAELRQEMADSRDAVAATQKRIERELQEMRAKVTSADYHSRPNGGKSAHDALMREIKATREDLAEHVATSVETHDEFASAIAYLADGRAAIDNLAEAMPLVARSQPHDDDAA